MGRVFMIMMSVGLMVSLSWAGEQALPKDEKKTLPDAKAKESYSLGYEFGGNLKRDGVDADMDVLFSGAKDAVEGKKPQLRADEMRAALKDLRERAVVEKRRRYEELKARDLQEGRAFLEANKAKEGVRTLPSGLQYTVIKEGDGPSPKADDQVKIHYSGRLIDGTEFDSSYSRRTPSVITVSAVIPGWTEALQMMKAGSKWQIVVPSELGYKDRGFGHIPPNSTLIFDLELLSIEKSGNRDNTPEQKLPPQ